MLAKVEIDGKEHIAVVIGERMGLDYIEEIKNSLTSFLESAYVGNGDNAEFLYNDMYNVMALINEMSLSEDQRIRMFSAYFNNDNKTGIGPQTKECKITF